MKTKITIGVIIVMAIVSIAASPPPETTGIVPKTAKQVSKQTYAGFSFFRIHRQGKNGVTSTWGMSSESGVTGYAVQRTYEDPNDPFAFWENICAMPCNGSRSYKWTDENVFPGFISYRILATMSSGGSILSEILTIHIVSH